MAEHVATRRGLPHTLRAMLRQRGYRALILPPGRIGELATPEGQAAVLTRRGELEAYTTALAVRAAGYFAPVLRVPDIISKLTFNWALTKESAFFC